MSEDSFPQANAGQFYQRMHHYTPRLWLTHVLIALNLGVFALMVATGVSPMEPLVSDLLKWGANYGPLTTQGEGWRWLTCMFVHIGVLHVAMNMYVLWSIGRFVERLLGQGGYLIVYILSGLAGSLASTTLNPQITSAGASGAVFGLFGAIFGYLLRNRHTLPPEILRGLLRSGGMFLVLNLAIGFTIPSIDMAGHIGGLAGGFLLGLLISGPLTEQAHARRPLRNALTALIGVIVLGGYAITLKPVIDYRAVLDRAVRTEQQIDLLVTDKLEQNRTGNISTADFAQAIRQQAIPELQKTGRELRSLELKSDQDRLRQLLAAVILAHEAELQALAEAAVNGEPANIDRLHAKQLARNRSNEELNAFFKKSSSK